MAKSYRKRNYYKTSGLVKRARGNLKASKSNTDSLTQTISFTSPICLSSQEYQYLDPYTNIPEGGDPFDYAVNLDSGVVALNIWDQLSRCPNFEAFKNMYDQVRLDYVSVVLNAVDSQININTQGQNTAKTFDIYTAWDRGGLNYQDVFPVIDRQGADVNVKFKVDKIFIGIGKRLAEYNCTKTVLNAFQRWRKALYIYPKSLQEKSQYVNTSCISVWRKPYDTTNCSYELNDNLKIPLNSDRKEVYNQFFNIMNSDNPGMFMENGKYPFKPTLLIGAFQSGISNNNVSVVETVAQSTKIILTADIKCVVTFRGSKGASAIS